MATRYRFGEFELDTLAGELTSASTTRRLPPKTLGVLHALLEHHERIVSLAELREMVWPDASVEFDSVHKAIAGARRALGDASGLIETVPRRGYRFIGEIDSAATSAEPVHPLGLVGRGRELERLERRLSDARGGSTQVALLMGPAGIGKTTLARAFLRHAEAGGALTAIGRAFEGEGALPYRPWLQIFRSLERKLGPGRLRDTLGSDVGHITGALPELAHTLGCAHEVDPETGAASDPWLHVRFFDAVGECLAKLSEARPLVLMFDDLHCADRDTIRLMAYVTKQVPEGSILFVGTTRHMASPHAARSEVVDRILRDQPEACIEVGRFGADEVGQMIEIHGRADASLDAAELADLSGGNPLIVSQWLAVGGAANELADLSSRGFQAMVERVIDGASPPTRAWLEVAAVFGREFSHAVVGNALDLTPDDGEAALDEAVRIGVLDREPETPGWHVFTHGLTPEVIVAGFASPALERAHACLVRALESTRVGAQNDSGLTLLAHHALSAGSAISAVDAVGHALRAARAARGRVAYDVALEFCNRAVERLAGEQDVEMLLAECLVEQGELTMVLGRWDESNDILAAAAEIALAHRHVGLTLAAVLGASAPGETGEIDLEHRKRLQRALELVDPASAPDARARLLAALGKSYSVGDHPRALELTAEAERIARSIGDPGLLIYVLQIRRIVTESPDRHAERRALTAELQRLAETHDDPFVPCRAVVYELIDAIEAGDRLSIDRLMSTELQLARRYDLAGAHYMARVHAAMLQLLEGRFGEGLALADDALEYGLRMQPGIAVQWHSVQRMTYELEVGDPSVMIDDLAELVRRFPTISTWPAALALAQLHSGDRETPRALLRRLAVERFTSIPRETNLPITLGLLAQIAHALDEATSATLLRELLQELPNRCICVGVAAGSQGSVARHVGLCAETIGDFEAAERAFEDGIEIDEALGARPFVAAGRLGLSRSIFARDPSDTLGRAAAALRLATEEAESLGMKALQVDCQRLRSAQRLAG